MRDRQTNRARERQGQTDRDRQTGTDRQKDRDRQTDRQTETGIHSLRSQQQYNTIHSFLQRPVTD